MSEGIYNRARVREGTIWPSFLYGIPGVEDAKTVVFGLYANSYLLGHNYLEEIETEELQRLVDVYESNMSELDMREQSLVLEIAAKRYTKTIELQIKNNALLTKEKKLDADEQDYEARLAALDVDQKALNTKQVQIELARDRAELKNKELEARIQLEELAQEYAAVEISQKELEAGKVELDILVAALKALEIQSDISNVSLQITKAEISKSQTEAELAGIEARIADQELMPTRLEIDQAVFDAMEYEVENVADKKVELIEAKGESIDDETTRAEELEDKEADVLATQDGEQDAQRENTLSGFDDRDSMALLEQEQSEYNDALSIEIAEDRKESKTSLATKRTDLPVARKSAASTAYSAAVDAAETLALADITNTLTHEIGSV